MAKCSHLTNLSKGYLAMILSAHQSRWLVPALLTLVMLLAACGGDGATPTTTTAPTEEPTTAPVEEMEQVEEPTTEPTKAADEGEPTDEATSEAENTTDEPDSDATVEAEAAASGAPTVRIEQDNSGLRAGPGVTYDRAGVANSGDILPVLGKAGEGQTLWYQVELPDGSIAWAWSRIATLLPADAEVPEVEPPAS